MRQPSLALRRLEQSDPVSIAFALHGIGLLLTDSIADPLPVSLSILLLVTTRVIFGIFAHKRSRPSLKLIREVITLLVVGVVMVADGGTESPFFFWLLFLLVWQAVTFSLADFRILVGFGLAVYVIMALTASDITGTSFARLGLLLAFILILGAGRLTLEAYQTRVRRLEHMVTAVISLAVMGVALYDSDRQTPLFANEAANALGLASHDDMAHLIPDETTDRTRIDTLASLVEGAGWLPYEPRLFRVMGHPTRKLRIGIQALRLQNAEPVVMVYGEEVPAGAETQPPT